VLDAYFTHADLLNREVTHEEMLAAALRALAYNVYSDEIVTCGGSSYALVIEQDDILAIAEELEAQ